VILSVILVFFVIFSLNLIPAFAPPTWLVFSFIGFKYPSLNVNLMALVGAVAATLGRVTLARLSRLVIRQKFMSPRSRANIDVIRKHVEQRREYTAGLFLFYAFTPFPSNYLFIAYGLTAMRLRLVAIPFLIGRTISYTLWGYTSSSLSRRLSLETSGTLPYLGVYFILSQVALLALVYAFARVDWRAVFDEGKFRWTKRGGAVAAGK
jgi:membrane protein YqaA with SNARE-associated domain